MKLEEYEKICPKCNETGLYLSFNNMFNTTGDLFWLDEDCDYCRGTGKISWVDIIKKKKL